MSSTNDEILCCVYSKLLICFIPLRYRYLYIFLRILFSDSCHSYPSLTPIQNQWQFIVIILLASIMRNNDTLDLANQ